MAIIGRIGKDGIYRQPGDPGFDGDIDSKSRILSISEKRPHRSVNAACHPDQVERFNKECVPGVRYEKGTGDMISTSAAARQREAKRRGKYFN